MRFKDWFLRVRTHPVVPFLIFGWAAFWFFFAIPLRLDNGDLARAAFWLSVEASVAASFVLEIGQTQQRQLLEMLGRIEKIITDVKAVSDELTEEVETIEAEMAEIGEALENDNSNRTAEG